MSATAQYCSIVTFLTCTERKGSLIMFYMTVAPGFNSSVIHMVISYPCPPLASWSSERIAIAIIANLSRILGATVLQIEHMPYITILKFFTGLGDGAQDFQTLNLRLAFTRCNLLPWHCSYIKLWDCINDYISIFKSLHKINMHFIRGRSQYVLQS